MDLEGVILVLSIIYSVRIKKVKKDIDKVSQQKIHELGNIKK